MSKNRGKASSAKLEAKSAVCNKVPGDNWLSCEICDKWFHASCVNIKAYKVMQELLTYATGFSQSTINKNEKSHL